MHKIEFIKAKNNQTSCSADGIMLHSSYDPCKEAERFVQTAPVPFSPKYILLTEPAISYCARYLKEKYPEAKICCIRYVQDFSQYDIEWNKTFYIKEEAALSEEIFSYMGEEGISACVFLSWKASEKVFKQENSTAWNAIKSAVLKSRSVLATRSYFAKRWTKNTLRFCTFAKNTLEIQKGNLPVVICASGPSLFSSLNKIKENRNKFFLIAVSSALSPLVNRNIIPDMCISTDGGYWAKLHLSFALKKHNIPLALPAEGCCFAENIINTKIIPLFYGDGISEEILKSCGYTKTPAQRNGSVSGTVAQLALNLTTGNIYFCGLDLSPSTGFAHTQPNELEINAARFDTRLLNSETRIAPSCFKNNSLEIYRSWFKNTDFKNRLFRLSDGYPYKNNLGSIIDVDWEKAEIDFEKNKNGSKIEFIKTTKEFNQDERINTLTKIIFERCKSEEWKKEAFTAEWISFNRSNDESKRKELELKMNSFEKDILKSLGK